MKFRGRTLSCGLAFVILSQTTSLQSKSQLFCSCEDCCDIQQLDFAASDFLSVPANPHASIIWPENSVEYDLVAALDVNPKLTHFSIVSTSAIRCADSVAHVTNMEGTMTSATVSMTQTGGKSCVVNWNNVFKSTFAYSSFNDIVVFFAFKDIAQVDAEITIVSDESSVIVTQFDTNRPLFVTDYLLPVVKNDVWSVDLSLRYFEERDADSCAFPDSVGFRIASCDLKTLDTLSSSKSNKKFRYTTSFTELVRCAEKTEEDNEGSITYTIPIIVEKDNTKLGGTCDKTKPLLSVKSSIFYLKISTDVSGINSIDEISNVRMRVVDYSMSEPCDGLLSPQGKMTAKVELSLSDVDFKKFIIQDKIYLEDGIFELVTHSETCKKEGSEMVVCSYVYASSSCLLMTNNEDGTCTFNNIGQIITQARYDRVDGSSSKVYEFSAVVPKKTFLSCSTPSQYELANNNFPVIVTASNNGGMNAPIDVEIKFADESIGADSSVTLKIYSVQVTGGGVTRTFLVDNKIALMESEGSPYHTDAHFCRYEPNNAGVCQPFYSTYKNAYVYSNTKMFNVASKGYERCEAMNVRNVDRFVFVPSGWSTFKNLVTETSVRLEVSVRATLDTCSTSRRLSSKKNRSLQGLLSKSSESMVSASTELVVQTPHHENVVTKDGVSMTLFVVVSASLGSVLLLGGLYILFYRRRNRSKETETTLTVAIPNSANFPL